MLGTTDGNSVSAADGITVGEAVGEIVGRSSFDGYIDGELDTMVGTNVGFNVLSAEGCIVGSSTGCNVGILVVIEESLSLTVGYSVVNISTVGSTELAPLGVRVSR